MDQISLGAALRAAREHCGLSQQEVADAMGLQRTAITLVEAGQRQVSTIELTQFAARYRKSVAELLESRETPEEDYLVVLYRLAPELTNDPRVKVDVEDCLELCRIGIDLEKALGRSSRQGPPKFSLTEPKNTADAVSQGFEVAGEERR